MNEKKILGIKRGYFYCFIASFTISILSALKYTMYLTKYHDEQDQKRFITFFILHFLTLLIPSLLLARWYYKMKSENSKK